MLCAVPSAVGMKRISMLLSLMEHDKVLLASK